MTSFVTVVFDEEILSLKTQAQSLHLFCDIDVTDIKVVINQDTQLDIDPEWWGRLSDRVSVYHRNDFEPIKNCPGWVSQQILKLQSARTSKAETSIVLDAKTLFVKKVSTMFEKGKPACGTISIPPVFNESRDIVNKLFNTNLTDCIGPGGVPFFFQTSVVDELISFVEHKTKQPFNDWFVDQGRVTEFILYSAFVMYKYQTLSVLYADQKFNVWNVCHSQAKDYDLWFDRLLNLNPVTVSIHRNAWSQLSPEQQQSYTEYLTNKGITSVDYMKTHT